MKKILLLSAFLFSAALAHAQFIATMEIEEPIEGMCGEDVYVLFSALDVSQKQAETPISEELILKKMNELAAVQDNPKLKVKRLGVEVVVNCHGEVIQVEVDGSDNEALIQEVEALFLDLGNWKAGTMAGLGVDSVRLFSYQIKKGEVTNKY